MWKQFAIGQLAVQALHKTYAAFKNIVADSIKNAIDQEEAEASLRAAIEITGRTVQGNLKHYLDFAAAQQKVTLYTDEEIEAAQALLLQFTNLNQNGIDRLTKGAMGLATVMKTDLDSAAQKIIMGLKGQEVGLRGVGIKIDENLTREEKQASLLDQLEKLYQRSTKETETFGGSLKQLKKSWDELLETAGATVIKNEAVQETIKRVKEWVDKLADDPNFKVWLNEITRLLNAVAWAASKVPKAAKDITEWLSPLRAEEAGLARETTKMNAAFERFIAAGHGWHGTTVAVTAAAKAATPAINETGNAVEDESNKVSELVKNLKTLADNTEVTHPSIAKLETAFNNASKTGTVLASDLRPIAERLIELKTQAGEKVPTALFIMAGKLGDTVVPLNRFKLTVESIELALFKMGFSGVGATLKLDESLVGAGRNLDKLAAKMGFTSFRWTESQKKMYEETKKTWDNIFQCVDVAVNAINNAIQQGANARTTILNNEYQNQLNNIKKSEMNEKEKNAAIEGLDAEFDIKRRALQHKLAVQGKTTSIAMAIINTAEAVTKALAYAPPPFNIILAAISSAAGALQIGLIRAQPIPLAAGAIFKKPVFSSGRDYMAGEAGPEAVIPLSELPRIMREFGGDRERGYQTERPIIIQNHIFLDSREMKKFTTNTVKESGRLGFLGRVGKEMA